MNIKLSYVTILTECAFCGEKMEVRVHHRAKIKSRYYCGEACKQDYRIVRDRHHRDHDHLLYRQKRLRGEA